MALESGLKLGHYTVADKIGEGGMGEVYRARDAKLDRDVAIKILPAAFAQDQQRLARFEREAKAVAALSHPNILAIYEFGRAGEVVYAAMELLEGETLLQALAGGSLPARKAVDYGRQMANGLAAAHEKGVTHRDLKPENVFITREGRIKILDFGLALVHPLAAAGGDGTSAPTSVPTQGVATNPGVVMGTAGYMSPEQVRGQAVDGRADIFALGTILYEMLTGKRAFSGASPADTLSAILREDPAAITTMAGGLPVGLEPLVLHCLEKNPDQRFQSARDLAFNLGAIAASPLSGAVSGAQAVLAGASGTTHHSGGFGWLTLATAALLAAAASAAAVMALLPGATGAPVLTNTLLTFRRGWVDSARFSPDGQTVIYGAAWGTPEFAIYATQPGSPGSRAIELGRPADLLAISPAGELALLLGRHPTMGMEMAGTLGTVPMQGGAPRQLLEDVAAADWGPDGKSLAVVHYAGGRTLLEYPVGTVLVDSPGWMSRVRVHPDGRRVAFIDHPGRGDNVGHAAVVDLEGNKTDLPGTATGVGWSADGRELWVFDFDGQIHAYHDDGSNRLVCSVPLTTGALLDVDGAGRALMTNVDMRREMAGGSKDEPIEKEQSWLNWSSPSGVSADLTSVLFDEQLTGYDPEGYQVYVRELSAGAPVSLAKGVGLGMSPEGDWVAVVRDPFGDRHIQLQSTGIGQARDLDLGDLRTQSWMAIGPEARSVVVSATAPGAGVQLYRHDVDTGATSPISGEGNVLTTSLAISPDGRHVAANSEGKDQLFIYFLEGDDTGGRAVPGAEPGERLAAWGAQPDIIYVFRPGAPPARVFRVNLATGERTPWLQVSPADTAGVFNIDRVFLSRDGRSYLYTYRRLLSRLILLEGLK